MNKSPAFDNSISLLNLFTTFLIIGATSFGGGIIAYLREYIVRRRKWLNETEFLTALEISQMVPGLIAINLSLVIGDKKRGIFGALVAILGMVLPGTIIILTLGIMYFHFNENNHINIFLIGAAAAAAGFMFKTTVEIGYSQLKKFRDLLFLVATFIAVGILHISLIIILLTIVPLSIWFYRPKIAKNKQE